MQIAKVFTPSILNRRTRRGNRDRWTLERFRVETTPILIDSLAALLCGAPKRHKGVHFNAVRRGAGLWPRVPLFCPDCGKAGPRPQRAHDQENAKSDYFLMPSGIWPKAREKNALAPENFVTVRKRRAVPTGNWAVQDKSALRSRRKCAAAGSARADVPLRQNPRPRFRPPAGTA